MIEAARIIKTYIDLHFDDRCECGPEDHCPVCVVSDVLDQSAVLLHEWRTATDNDFRLRELIAVAREGCWEMKQELDRLTGALESIAKIDNNERLSDMEQVEEAMRIAEHALNPTRMEVLSA